MLGQQAEQLWARYGSPSPVQEPAPLAAQLAAERGKAAAGAAPRSGDAAAGQAEPGLGRALPAEEAQLQPPPAKKLRQPSPFEGQGIPGYKPPPPPAAGEGPAEAASGPMHVPTLPLVEKRRSSSEMSLPAEEGEQAEEGGRTPSPPAAPRAHEPAAAPAAPEQQQPAAQQPQQQPVPAPAGGSRRELLELVQVILDLEGHLEQGLGRATAAGLGGSALAAGLALFEGQGLQRWEQRVTTLVRLSTQVGAKTTAGAGPAVCARGFGWGFWWPPALSCRAPLPCYGLLVQAWFNWSGVLVGVARSPLLAAALCRALWPGLWVSRRAGPEGGSASSAALCERCAATNISEVPSTAR